jgi:SNF2 family DNA or RNA helicase
MSITEVVRCALTFLHGTPVFIVPQIGAEGKRIFGATHMEQDGVWLFPAYFPYLDDVLHDFDIVLPNLKFSDQANAHIKKMRATPERLKGELADSMFVTDPFDHQREGTQFVLELLRCALFFDCGLGKTKTVIDALCAIGEKTLVLSPVVGLKNWCREVDIHSAGKLKAIAMSGESARARTVRLASERTIRKLKKELKEDPDSRSIPIEIAELKKKTSQKAAKLADIEDAAEAADILVVSYDTAKLYQVEIFTQFPYKVIVADESHFLRSVRSHRTKAAIALASKAYRRVLMSGTPTLGNPVHLFGQLKFLAEYIPAVDYYTFQKHYLIRGNKRHNRKMVFGYKNLDLLNDKVQRIALRRTKEECLDLPPRTIIDVDFEISAEQKKFYNDLIKYACVDLGDGKLYEADHAAVVLQKLLQIVSGFLIMPPEQICDGCEYLQRCVDADIKPYTKNCLVHTGPAPTKITRMKKSGKMDAFSELLESILVEERNKSIVWCYFREELNIVEEHLKKEKIKYVRVDGSNSRHVQKLADKFNDDPEVRVYLAQVGTGVAITLNAAAYMIYFGLTYKLDEYMQSMDRNYRIGQEVPVFVYRLVDENSVLSFVIRALEMKENLAETLTKRIDCMLCALNHECASRGVEPFSEDCLYPSKMKRVITRPNAL